MFYLVKNTLSIDTLYYLHYLHPSDCHFDSWLLLFIVTKEIVGNQSSLQLVSLLINININCEECIFPNVCGPPVLITRCYEYQY